MVFIEASLAYQGTNRGNNTALLEIVFNGRTPDNVPYYMVETDNEDELKIKKLIFLIWKISFSTL